MDSNVKIESIKIEDKSDAREHGLGAARAPTTIFRIEHERDDIDVFVRKESIRRGKPKPEGPGNLGGSINYELVVGLTPKDVPRTDLSVSPKGMRSSDTRLSSVSSDMSMLVYENAIHLFHLLVWPRFRGRGYGEALIDIFVAFSDFLGVDYMTGFVGNGDTREFLKTQGFSGARYELWTAEEYLSDYITKPQWAFCEGKKPKFEIRELEKDYESYWELPEDIKKDFSPNTCDLAEKFGDETIQGSPGAGALHVRKDAAEMWWKEDYNIWFLDETDKVIAERKGLLPLSERRAPVINKAKRGLR